ncbi:MAG: sulfatase [Lacipirellulaceae bacterium]
MQPVQSTFLLSFLITNAFYLAVPLGIAQESRPNVLLIVADDLGWTDLSCYGSTFYETPHLDGLAAEGVRFTDAYAACPVCSPTRAAIQTGMYPARMDTTDWFGAPQPNRMSKHWTRDKPLLPAPYVERLPESETTLAELFQNAGYQTFFAGKWHLGPKGSWPEDHGYQINKGGWERGGPYGPGKYFVPYGNPRLEDGPPGEHLPDRLARETVDFMKDCKGKPFFAMLSFYSVHTPLIARDDLKAKYEEKRTQLELATERFIPEGERQNREVQDHAVYAGMVEAMDLAVGRVLQGLHDQGLEDNTIVIFTSDNGGLSTAEGSPTSNRPLRAGKGWLYEGGIRVPLIVRVPGSEVAGETSQAVVTSTDYFPALLTLTGSGAEDLSEIDGSDFSPVLTGDEFEREASFWHYPHYGNQGGAPGAAIREGHWKLIHWFEDGRRELFDLANDLGEKHNLADQHPDVAERLAMQLENWQQSVEAKMPTPNPNAK